MRNILSSLSFFFRNICQLNYLLLAHRPQAWKSYISKFKWKHKNVDKSGNFQTIHDTMWLCLIRFWYEEYSKVVLQLSHLMHFTFGHSLNMTRSYLLSRHVLLSIVAYKEFYEVDVQGEAQNRKTPYNHSWKVQLIGLEIFAHLPANKI